MNTRGLRKPVPSIRSTTGVLAVYPLHHRFKSRADSQIRVRFEA
jgi:hypothetical protein